MGTWSQEEKSFHVNHLKKHVVFQLLNAFQEIDEPHSGVDERHHFSSGVHHQTKRDDLFLLYLLARHSGLLHRGSTKYSRPAKSSGSDHKEQSGLFVP